MRQGFRRLGRATAMLLLAATAGCGVNRDFVYKPGKYPAGAPQLSVEIGVLPFSDGTEDFVQRGSIFKPETVYYNLVKPDAGSINRFPAGMWGKAFAQELATSGRFRSVRFVFAPSDLVTEKFYVEGMVEKAVGAYEHSANRIPNIFALRLRAKRLADGKQVWEKSVSKSWTYNAQIADNCDSTQCIVDRYHAEANRAMQEMFAEAEEDLAARLEADATGGAAVGPGAATPETVDSTIERILKMQ